MLLERFFPQPSVNFLDSKKNQKNSKSGQKLNFSNFFLHIRNLHQKLHIPTKFRKYRMSLSKTTVYRQGNLTKDKMRKMI